MKKLLISLLAVLAAPFTQAREIWTPEKANAWHAGQPWLVGANFLPSSAINQLEMWQAETFDEAGIDRELGWAASLGFNSMRVFLHDIVWEQGSEAYLKRIDRFLEIAAKHKIGIMVVFFDSVWDPFPKAGKQRDPKPGLHNSGWMQSPGKEILLDPAKFDKLKPFVTGVVSRFKNDPRVQVWDVWNEPDNKNGSSYGKHEPDNKMDLVAPLLAKAFSWCREADPSQPLTSGVWIGQWPDHGKLNPMEKVQIENSDVISFHSYDGPDKLRQCIKNLRRYNRPVLCTEYMARGNGSFFDPHMGIMKEEKVAAYNWGFVDGKSQTIMPWDSWKKPYDKEPDPWFHDIFRKDGTSYRQAEVDYIRKTTGKKQ